MKPSRRKITFLIFSALCIFSFAFFVVAQENSTSDKNIFLDSDQDGLSDDEEKTYGTDPNNRDTDGDGYSDGAEVKSGYDPTKPAPGDKIINDTQQLTTNDLQQNGGGENLTQELSEEVANLINQKAGENQDIALEDLDALIEKTTSEELTFDDLPAVDEKEIKIKKQNYSKLSDEEQEAKKKEDALEYLTTVAYIFINNSPQKITDQSDLEKMFQEIVNRVESFSSNLSDVSYFENLADRGQSALEQLREVEVPENFVDFHIKGIKLVKYATSLKNEARPSSNDPISSIVNLSKVQNLMNLTTDFTSEIDNYLQKLGISEIPIEP